MKTQKLFPTHSSFAAMLAVLAALLIQFAAPTGARAGTLYWDGNGTGAVGNPPTSGVGTAGTWATSSGANWWTGTAYQLWNAAGGQDIADFRGTAGAVTVSGTVNVTNLIVRVNAYTFQTGTINFPTTGAGGIIEVNTFNAATFSATLSGKVTLNATGNTGTSSSTAVAIISGNNTGLTSFELNTGGAGNLVTVSSVGAFGANGSPLKLTKGVFNYNAAAGSTYNSWVTDFAGGALRQRVAGAASTYSGNGTLSANTEFGAIAAATLIYSGTLDLGANTLTLAPAISTSFITLNGAVSGSGNLTINPGTLTGLSTPVGTVTLGTANPSFTGTATTTATFGTLALNNVNALQAATLDTGASSGVQAVTFTVAGNNTYNLGALTGSDALAIGANTLSVGAKAVDTTFSAVISGSTGKLTKVGTNKLTLATSPTYDGLTTISAGTLALNNTIALAAASSVSLAAGSTLDVSANATYTWGASASLTASGTGTTALTDAAEIKGGTTVDLGSRPVTLNFTPTSFAGDSTHPALYVSAGALTINGAISVTNNGASPLSNGIYILIRVVGGSSTGTPTLSGNVVGGQGLVAGKNALIQRNVGTGDIELTVQDALTPTITLTRHSGTVDNNTYGDALQFDASVTGAGATPTGTVELRDGGPAGTLLASGSLVDGTNTFPLALNALTAGAHTLYAVYSGDATYLVGNNTLSQTVLALSVTVSGASADNKAFDNTTTATLTGGTVVTAVSGDTGSDINANGGTFANVGPGSAISVTMVLGGAKASSYSLASPPALTADIVAAAIWTNTLGGTWSTAGNWTNNLIGSGTNVTADFNQVDLTATTTVTNDTARTIGNMIFGDANTNTAFGWVVTNNTITLAGTTPTFTVNTFGGSAKVTVNSILAGTSGLTKNGVGTLTLTGVNTYSGGTVVSNGILTFNADAALGATSANNITLNGGTLGQLGASVALSSARSMTIGADGGTLANISGTTLTYSGIISGSGLLTLNVPGGGATGISLFGQSTNTGGASFTGSASSFIYMSASSTGVPGSLVSGPFGTGTVTFNGPGTRSTTSGDTTNGNAIIFAADTIFATAASEKTLTLAGPVTLSSNRTLTVNVGATVAGKTVTITNVISDGGNNYSLTKAGTGTLILSGPNTYGSNTIVSGGTLTLSGSGSIGSSPSIDVQGGARLDVTSVSGGFTLAGNQTLKGNGTVGGSVSIAAGGILAPGASVGKLTFTNNLTLSATSTNQFEFDVAGSTNDRVACVDLTPNGSVIALDITGGTLATGTYRLFDYSGSKTGTFGTPAITSGSAAGNLRIIESVANQINLLVNAVPVVVDNSFDRGAGTSIKLTIASLLANDSDSDGGTVHFVGTSATTTNGATLSNDGTKIYVPTSSVADAFTYTIDDGQGGTNTGTVTIAISTATGQGTATIDTSSTNAIVNFFGIPGSNYSIQVSVDAMATWTDLVTNTAPASGVMTYTDVMTTNAATFYRLRYVP